MIGQEKQYLLSDDNLSNAETTYSSLHEAPLSAGSPSRRWLERYQKSWWLIILTIVVGYIAGILTVIAGGIFPNHHIHLKSSYCESQDSFVSR